MISVDTLIKRLQYGGRKGRSAKRRLAQGIVYAHPDGSWIQLRAKNLPITTQPALAGIFLPDEDDDGET